MDLGTGEPVKHELRQEADPALFGRRARLLGCQRSSHTNRSDPLRPVPTCKGTSTATETKEDIRKRRIKRNSWRKWMNSHSLRVSAVLFVLLLHAVSADDTNSSDTFPSPSAVPLLAPTTAATMSPTLSFSSTPSSALPSTSAQPSLQPSVSKSPSSIPSPPPTMFPTHSKTPSFQPTASQLPTELTNSTEPSFSPTDFPSLIIYRQRSRFRHDLAVPTNSSVNVTEGEYLMEVYASYTANYTNAPIMETNCSLANAENVFVGEDVRTSLTFYCQWTSQVADALDGIAALFVTFINNNTDMVINDMLEKGLEVIAAADTLLLFEEFTASPTISPKPTDTPSSSPSFSLMPSAIPSGYPSVAPTSSPSIQPTQIPSVFPSTVKDEIRSEDRTNLVIGIVLTAGVLFVAAMLVLYCQIKKRRAMHSAAVYSDGVHNDMAETHMLTGLVTSPSESLRSNKSYLSVGDSRVGEESGDENDLTKNLKDEFDQYRNEHIETLRSGITAALPNYEGVMSAILTKTLMGEEVEPVSVKSVLWDCPEHPTPRGEDIEASALCEVNDWLKRHETDNGRETREYMQAFLDRMVTTVSHGALNAEDATRCVHEAAVLLGLSLANELPMTTVIIAGMRKTVSTSQMMSVMSKFGAIDAAAVASNQRGFGIVRYRNKTSVDKALKDYRSTEIVIQDVAIQMKVLRPHGVVEA